MEALAKMRYLRVSLKLWGYHLPLLIGCFPLLILHTYKVLCCDTLATRVTWYDSEVFICYGWKDYFFIEHVEGRPSFWRESIVTHIKWARNNAFAQKWGYIDGPHWSEERSIEFCSKEYHHIIISLSFLYFSLNIVV